jgi:hypothetical protein
MGLDEPLRPANTGMRNSLTDEDAKQIIDPGEPLPEVGLR